MADLLCSEDSHTHRQELPPGHIHVWIFDTSAAKPAWDRLLSPIEAATAQRLAYPHQRRFKNRRAALRLLLGRYLEVSPTLIEYAIEDNGKPFLANKRLSFNVAHSEDVAIIALGTDCDIGVDIEKAEILSDHADIAAHFFTEHEREYLANLPLPMRKRAFLTIWTRKEAVLKANGTGISNGVLLTVPDTVQAHGLEVVQEINGKEQSFYIYDINAGPDFIASLALSRETCRVVTQTIEN